MADQRKFIQPKKGGPCTRLLHYYSSHLEKPPDNGIWFWEKVVREFFAPNAVYRLADGKPPESGVPVPNSQKPLRSPGLEAHYEILPRLHMIKYSNGLLEETLYMGALVERHNELPGVHTLRSQHAVEHSRYATVSIFRTGILNVIFDADTMKIKRFDFEVVKIERAVHEPIVRHELNYAKKVLEAQIEALNDPKHGKKDKRAQHLQESYKTVTQSLKRVELALGYQSMNVEKEYGQMRRFMRCIQVADTVSSMQPLMQATGPGESPLAALQQYGNIGRKSSARPQEGQNPPGSPGPWPSPDPMAQTLGNLMGSSGLHRSNPTSAAEARPGTSPSPSLLDQITPKQEPMGLLTPAQLNPVNLRLGSDGQPPAKKQRLYGGPHGLGGHLMPPQLSASTMNHLAKLGNTDLSGLTGGLNPSVLAQLTNGAGFPRQNLGLGPLSAGSIPQLAAGFGGSLDFLSRMSSPGMNGLGEPGSDALRGAKGLPGPDTSMNGMNGVNGMSIRSEAVSNAIRASKLLSGSGMTGMDLIEALRASKVIPSPGNGVNGMSDIQSDPFRAGRTLSSAGNGLNGMSALNGMSDILSDPLRAGRGLSSAGNGMNGLSDILSDPLRAGRGLSSAGNGLNGMTDILSDPLRATRGLSSAGDAMNEMRDLLTDPLRAGRGPSSAGSGMDGLGGSLPDPLRGPRGLLSSGNGMGGVTAESLAELIRANRAFGSAGNGMNGARGIAELLQRGRALDPAGSGMDRARDIAEMLQRGRALTPSGSGMNGGGDIADVLNRGRALASAGSGMDGANENITEMMQRARALTPSASGMNGASENMAEMMHRARALTPSRSGMNGASDNSLAAVFQRGRGLGSAGNGLNGAGSDNIADVLRGRVLGSPSISSQAQNALMSNIASQLQGNLGSGTGPAAGPGGGAGGGAGGETGGTPDYGLAQRRQPRMSPTVPQDDRG